MAYDAILSEAFIRGRRDAGNGLTPALNPYPPGGAEAAEWWRGHQSSEPGPACAAPGGFCPLAFGECANACYLVECERECQYPQKAA